MEDRESDIGQNRAALVDPIGQSWNEMACELLVNLVASLLELLWLELRANRLLGVILADPPVTLKAKGNGIVLVVSPTGTSSGTMW